MPYSGQFLAENLVSVTQFQLEPFSARQNASKVLRKSMAAVDVAHQRLFFFPFVNLLKLGQIIVAVCIQLGTGCV